MKVHRYHLLHVFAAAVALASPSADSTKYFGGSFDGSSRSMSVIGTLNGDSVFIALNRSRGGSFDGSTASVSVLKGLNGFNVFVTVNRTRGGSFDGSGSLSVMRFVLGAEPLYSTRNFGGAYDGATRFGMVPSSLNGTAAFYSVNRERGGGFDGSSGGAFGKSSLAGVTPFAHRSLGGSFDGYAFFVLDNYLLPIQLSSFAVTARRLEALLSWRTLTETSNSGFEIERRRQTNTTEADGGWQKVGFVGGAGTSSVPREYLFADKVQASGRFLYRLKQVEQTGSFNYSVEVEALVGEAPREFTLAQNYPNPFNPSTTIEFTLPSDGRATLVVYNILGQEVASLVNEEMKAGVYQQATFNAGGLATGLYIARLEFGGKALLKKLLLMK